MGRWTELALKVANAKRLAATQGDSLRPPMTVEGERAMKELEPFVIQTARRIHHGHQGTLRKQRALDFIAAAPAMVWSKVERFEQWYDRELSEDARADQTKEWFSAWCRVELRYRYLDHGRAQAEEQKLYSLADYDTVADGRVADGRATDGDSLSARGGFELGVDDVERIRGWDAMDGVILFCLTEQWDKVPAEVWRSWLNRLGLSEPFPPMAFIQAARPKKRAILAETLGVSRDVIYQRWLRLKTKMRLRESSMLEGSKQKKAEGAFS